MLTKRIDELDADWVLRYLDSLVGDSDVINLTVGSPSFDTPEELKSVAYEGLKAGWTKYTPTAGIRMLRELIAEHYNEKWGCDLSYKNVVVTAGATNALFLTFFSLLNEGDDVVLFTPTFPAYSELAKLAGSKTVAVVTRMEDSFKPRLEEVSGLVTKRTRLIVVNSPSNPTGAVYNSSLLGKIVDIASEVGAYVVSDEVYDNYVYTDNFESLARSFHENENVVIVNSFSKIFSMTGWRIGYLIAPEPIADRATRLQVYVNTCPPSISQYVALHALSSKDSESWRRSFREFCMKGRDIISERLREAGIELFVPEGGFYVFPRIPFDLDSESFCNQLLSKKSVAVLPGKIFGPGGEGHFRVTFAVDHDKLLRAGKLIREFLEGVG